jgi:8-amino-7-oxononanoate synthase
VRIEQRIHAELAAWESQAELRDLESTSGVDFSSNDYLGLAQDPRMKQAVREALDSSARVASTGSRLLSGHDAAWSSLETAFARWTGAEAALYFSSGYAANLGLLGAVLSPQDVVFSDSANHASLIDGIRLSKSRRVVYPHMDLNALEGELRWNASAGGARFIVVESVFSMDGDVAPLGELAALARRYQAELIVDEAHATGVYGPGGRGRVAEAGLAGKIFATMHTCGKALASAGAFVCGSEDLRRYLINRARTFIFSTALPPYFVAQVAEGVRLAESAEPQRRHLREIGNRLRSELMQQGFDCAGSESQIVPVVLGPNQVALDFAAKLRCRGYGIRAIRPPTVAKGTARLRLSLTANMTQSSLDDLVAQMISIRQELLSTQAASTTP